MQKDSDKKNYIFLASKYLKSGFQQFRMHVHTKGRPHLEIQCTLYRRIRICIVKYIVNYIFFLEKLCDSN